MNLRDIETTKIALFKGRKIRRIIYKLLTPLLFTIVVLLSFFERIFLGRVNYLIFTADLIEQSLDKSTEVKEIDIKKNCHIFLLNIDNIKENEIEKIVHHLKGKKSQIWITNKGNLLGIAVDNTLIDQLKLRASSLPTIFDKFKLDSSS